MRTRETETKQTVLLNFCNDFSAKKYRWNLVFWKNPQVANAPPPPSDYAATITALDRHILFVRTCADYTKSWIIDFLK